MNCNKIKKLISRYFDKQTTIQEESIIFEHIKVCAKCKEEFELFKKIYLALPEYNREVNLSEYFNDKLFVRINENEKKHLRDFVFDWRVAFSVLGILVIFLSGVFINPCKSRFKEYNMISYEIYPEEEVDLAMLEIYSNFGNL